MMFERRAAMATLLADRPNNLFVVPGLGSCTWDAFAAGDRRPQLLSLGRDGRRGDDRARPCAGAAEAPRRRHHRRRRDADGARQPRHHRRAAAGQPRDRGVRQRPLWRDRHAGEPHPERRRSVRRRRAAAASSACSMSRTRPACANSPACSRAATARCSRACRSRRTIRRACCRRRTASPSRIACAARWSGRIAGAPVAEYQPARDLEIAENQPPGSRCYHDVRRSQHDVTAGL